MVKAILFPPSILESTNGSLSSPFRIMEVSPPPLFYPLNVLGHEGAPGEMFDRNHMGVQLLMLLTQPTHLGPLPGQLAVPLQSMLVEGFFAISQSHRG
ncbi:hypothetical protein LIER_29937 [Lithospermum erythrorhizon]|uniref:Uncharacterized protein n=1 Tax=Lithospermum erythrorhizon TaxID=34254 RepID=A0AAV3RR36_LITER